MISDENHWKSSPVHLRGRFTMSMPAYPHTLSRERSGTAISDLMSCMASTSRSRKASSGNSSSEEMITGWPLAMRCVHQGTSSIEMPLTSSCSPVTFSAVTS